MNRRWWARSAALAFTLTIALLAGAVAPAAAEPRTRADREYNTAAGLFNRGEFSDALQQLDFFIGEFPDDNRLGEAHFLRSECFYRLAVYEDALAAYRRTAELFPSGPRYDDAISGMAWSLFRLQRHAEAAAVWAQLQPISTEFREEAAYRIADCAFLDGDYARAENLYKDFLATFPNAANADEVRYWLAVSYQKQGKTQPFLNTMETIIALGGGFADESLYALGSHHLEAGNRDRARECFQSALSRFPDSDGAGRALLALATLAFADRDDTRAVTYLERLANKAGDPLAAQGGYHLGRYHLQAGDTPAAAARFRNLVAAYPVTEPYRGYAVLALGDLEMAAGNYAAARALYSQAATLPDWSPELTLMQMARSYYLEMNYSEAKPRLERILADYPASPSARQARPLLAQVLSGLGKPVEARAALAAIPAAEQTPEEKFLLAKLYYDNGEYNEALAHFSRFTADTGPWREPGLYWLGATQLAAGDYARAEDNFALYQQRYPAGALLTEVAVALGELYLRVDQPAKARAAYARALAGAAVTPPLRERAAYGLARVAYEEEKYPDAVREFLAYLKEYPAAAYRPEALYFLASANCQLGHYDRAIEYCDIILAQHRGSALLDDAFLLKGKALYFQKKNRESIDVLNRLLIQYPRSPLVPDAKFYLAKATLREGQTAVALAYVEALAGIPRLAFADRVAYLQGEIYLETNQDSRALGAFERASRSGDPALKVLAFYKRGQCYHNLHEYGAAVDALLAAVHAGARGEQLGQVRLLLGKTYYKLGRYAEASESLQAAADHLTGEVIGDAWYWLADVRFKTGDFAGVVAALDRYLAQPAPALRLDALYRKGDALFNLNREKEAIVVYDELIRSAGTNPLADFARSAQAQCHLRLNENELALRAWLELENSANRQLQQQARFNIAVKFYQDKDFASAKKYFTLLIETYPDLPNTDEVLHYQSLIALQEGKTTEALATAQSLLTRFPQSPFRVEAQYTLGEAALREQDYPRAETAYRAYLQGLPDGPNAPRARLGLGIALYFIGRLNEVRVELQPLLAAADAQLAAQARFYTTQSWFEEKRYREAAASAEELAKVADPQLQQLGLTILLKSLAAEQRDAEILRQADRFARLASGPGGVDLLVTLAEVESRSGDAARALAWLIRASELATDAGQRASLLLKIAQQEYANGAYDAARRHAELAAGLPAALDEERRYLAVRASFMLDDAEGIIRQVEDSRGKYPAGKYVADLTYILALAYARQGEDVAACNELEKALARTDLTPELRGKALVALGRAYLRRGLLLHARQRLEEAARLNREELKGELAFLTGVALLAEKKYDAAREQLTAALASGQLAPAEVHYQLAAVAYGAGDFAAATNWLAKLPAADAERMGFGRRYHAMLGRMAVARREWDRARAELERALDGLDPQAPPAADDLEARYWHGVALADGSGQRVEARAEWERVVDAAADELAIEAQLKIADSLLADRQFAEARTAYYKVVSNWANRDWLDDAMLGMAVCDRELGNRERMRKDLEELLRNYPDGDRAAEARRLLEELK